MRIKTLMLAAMVTLMTAAPLLAQESGGGPDARGYVSGLGGFASSITNTTGDMQVEGGVRIAPHVMWFGTIGRFANLQSDLQPTLDAATSTLAANQGIGVTGGGTLPAWYGVTGVRVEIPTSTRFMPYVLGGVGLANLNPQPTFSFASGTLPDGTTPSIGTDVTSALTTSGGITAPVSDTAFMFSLGGGVQVPVASHWIVDAGYRYSRIAADTTLSTTALTTNGMTFGVGYRF